MRGTSTEMLDRIMRRWRCDSAGWSYCWPWCWRGLGARELMRLPIDAVPDITNRQVQITTIAPALGPEEVERQVTFPLETALAGLPGLVETRSLSRHGFSQITAVFTDRTDIYFARNLINERVQASREDLPGGLSAVDGAGGDRPGRGLHLDRRAGRARRARTGVPTSRRKASGWSPTRRRRPICARSRTGSWPRS